MRVLLLNANPSADLSHHRNEFAIISRLAGCSRRHSVTDTAADADLILVAGPVQNPFWPDEIWRHSVTRQYPRKCARVGTEDRALMWLPGLYASLPARFAGSFFSGAPYPHVAVQSAFPENMPLPAKPGASDHPTLYSFMGAFDTWPLRRRLALIQDARFRVTDTSRHPGRGYGQPHSVYQQYARQYEDSLSRSLFILCPRGAGSSSIRIFEAMKAGRVPVIISDAWVPPPGPQWGTFSVRVGEQEIHRLPVLLRELEPRGVEMASNAFAAWKKFFCADALFDYLVDAAGACAGADDLQSLTWARWRQVCSWSVIRLGLMAKIRTRIRSGSRPIHPPRSSQPLPGRWEGLP